LKEIEEGYKSGKILSGEVKKELIQILQDLVKNH